MSDLFTELKRRNVFRVGLVYVVVAWILAQVAELALDSFDAPGWVIKAFLMFLALGFPVALIFAWAFEITPEGLKKEKDVDRTQSITPETGRKLDYVIVGLLVLGIGYLAADKFFLRDAVDQPADTAQVAETDIGAAATAELVEAAAAETLEASVAVLPFTTRSSNDEDIFFTDGVHDDLLTQLAKIGSLKVISRTSVMEYRDTTKKIPEIADELGVATVLEGAVQRAGTRVRINAQLISADTDEHLWAETFDRELSAENIFDIQSEIALSIAAALKTTLSPEEQTRLETPLTNNLEAMNAYRRADHLLNTLEIGDADKAERELMFALELDPAFAAAYAMQARLQLGRYWFDEPDPKYRELAWEAIEKARSLDPDLPEADISEGRYYYWGFLDYDKAREFLARASAKVPNNAELHRVLGWVRRRDGDFAGAIEVLRRAAELDPRNINTILSVSETYGYLLDWDSMEEWLDRGESVDPASTYLLTVRADLLEQRDGDIKGAQNALRRAGVADFFVAFNRWRLDIVAGDYEAALSGSNFGSAAVSRSSLSLPAMIRGLTHFFAGDPDAARAELEQARGDLEARRTDSPEDARIYRALCWVYAGLGDADAARQICEQSLVLAPVDAIVSQQYRRGAAIGLAMVGDADRALDLIEETLSLPAGYSVPWYEFEPGFRSIHDHPRFLALMDAHRPD